MAAHLFFQIINPLFLGDGSQGQLFYFLQQAKIHLRQIQPPFFHFRCARYIRQMLVFPNEAFRFLQTLRLVLRFENVVRRRDGPIIHPDGTGRNLPGSGKRGGRKLSRSGNRSGGYLPWGGDGRTAESSNRSKITGREVQGRKPSAAVRVPGPAQESQVTVCGARLVIVNICRSPSINGLVQLELAAFVGIARDSTQRQVGFVARDIRGIDFD
jgi:hypothetical protein